MVGARIKGMYEAEAKERQEATRAKPGEQVGQVVANLPPREPGKSRDKAAAAVNVSPRSVESASRVIEAGAPALADLGWTQARIAGAMGCDRSLVARRIGWHREAGEHVRRAVFDGMFDEGHVEAACSTSNIPEPLHPWLTTAQAQSELVAEVLGKHRGSSGDPTCRERSGTWDFTDRPRRTRFRSQCFRSESRV